MSRQLGPPRRKSDKKDKKSPLQQAGAKFVDQLGARAIEALKVKLGLNTETKCFYDQIGGSVLVTTASAIMGYAAIPQGVTPITRVGSSLRVTRMFFRWSISAAATTTAGCTVRVLIAWRDKTVVGSLINNTALLQITTDTNSHYAYSLVTGASGIKLLFDKCYYIGVPTSDISTVNGKFTVDEPDFEMEWTQADTTGASGNLLRGDIEVFVFYGAVGGTIGTAPSMAIDRLTEFVDN